MKLAGLFALFALLACIAASQEAPNVSSPDAPTLTSPEAWVMFKQCASQWGSQELGTCSLDVCAAGCAMSSVAMYLATRGWTGNPGTLNAWLDKNGGYEDGCDIVWASVDKLGYTTFMGMEDAAYSAICSGAAAGHGVVINVRNGEHWVLVTGCPSGSTTVMNVNDPGFNQSTYVYADIVHQAVYHQV